MTPIYVDPFLGAASVWLALLNPRLVAPCAWMGGKRRLAEPLLRMLGLEPGRPVPAVLGDASWWGWVWPLLLDEVSGPVVCRWLLSWRGEEPRALWFRLRDAGPPADPIERAAGLLWLQARAANGVPVWWQEDAVVSMDGHGRGPYPAWQATCEPKLIAGARRADARTGRDAGQRGATKPRLLASDGRGVPREAGHKADKSGEDRRTGGMIDPGTIAERLDAVRLVMAARGAGMPRQADIGKNDGHREKHGWRAFTSADVAGRLEAIRANAEALSGVVVEHRSALDLTREWAPILGDRARVYLDPPYQGATGYPATCPRDEVLAIADTWARHGARVVLSEACGLAAELGAGWTEVCLRRAGKPEWATVYGGQVEARHGRLFGAAR